MSELSEAYYLAAATEDDGEALLAAAGLSGWVFPPLDGWVTVVPDTPFRGSPADALVRDRGLTACFVHAEDHGWGLWVWVDGSPVWAYRCSWDPELSIVEPGRAGDLARVLAAHGIEVDEAELDGALRPVSIADVVATRPARRAARAIRLPHHEWLRGPHPAARYVDHGGAATTPDLGDWEQRTVREMTPVGFPVPSDATYVVASASRIVTLALGIDGDLDARLDAMEAALAAAGFTVARGLDGIDARVLGAISEDAGLTVDELGARSSATGEAWLGWARGDDLGAVSLVRLPRQRRPVPPMLLTVHWLRSREWALQDSNL